MGARTGLLLFGLPPLLLGLIGRVKALVAGRSGPPLLQPYRDLFRLLRKGAVYSRTTTWVFRSAPIVALASTIAAGALLPLATPRAPLAFDGDLVLFVYLLGLGRFLTMAAALDTGSSFEGMGASREAAFSALAEPAIFLGLVTLVVATRSAFAQWHLPEPVGDLRGESRAVAGRRRPRRRAARGELAHADRRPEHAPGADDGSRGHGARSLRPRPRVDRVRQRHEAVRDLRDCWSESSRRRRWDILLGRGRSAGRSPRSSASSSRRWRACVCRA